MKTMPTANDQDLDQLANLFQLLSDKTRLRILILLADGENNVTKLCQKLDLPQPTVSHHLGLLRIHNVIGNRRHGKQVFYFLNGTVNVGPSQSLQLNLENLAVKIVPLDD
jgi:DNA-binding transcriptional ArsR family regulator